jgi:hypothetical protein
MRCQAVEVEERCRVHEVVVRRASVEKKWPEARTAVEAIARG